MDLGPNSFKLYSLWVLIQILLCPWLPGSVAVDIELCKPKIVVLDIKENRKNYIIPYEICEEQDSVCCLSNGKGQCYDPTGIPGVGIIKRVNVNTESNEKIMKLPHDSENFNVTLQGERFLSVGVYNWKVSYQYEKDCVNRVMSSPETCKGWVHLNLMILAIDLVFSLNTDTSIQLDEHETKVQIKEGDTKNILKCSADFGNELIPQVTPRFKFLFSTSQDLLSSTAEDYNKTLWCNETETVVQDGNWIVSREENACFLILTDFGTVDNGYYRCIVYFPNSNSPYYDDLSHSVSLLSQNELKASQPIINLIFVITIVVGSLLATFIIIPVSAYAFHSLYNSCRQRPQPQNPEPRHQADRGGYGTFPDLRRPSSPDQTLSALQSPNKRLAEAETNLSDTDHEQQSSPVKSKSHLTSHFMSLSDDDLMDLQRAGEEKTPPCNHEPKQKITCKYCKKSYCSECQGPFLTRHVSQCQYTSSGGGASQNRLDSAEPDSGSNSDTPDAFGTSSEHSQSS